MFNIFYVLYVYCYYIRRYTSSIRRAQHTVGTYRLYNDTGRNDDILGKTILISRSRQNSLLFICMHKMTGYNYMECKNNI